MIFGLQKLSILKRISAWMLDIILLSILSVGFAFLISLICNFTKYQEEFANCQEQYDTYENTYGSYIQDTFGSTLKQATAQLIATDYNSLSAEDKLAYDAYKALPVDTSNDYAAEYAQFERQYGEQVKSNFSLSFKNCINKLLASDYSSLSKAEKDAVDAYKALPAESSSDYAEKFAEFEKAHKGTILDKFGMPFYVALNELMTAERDTLSAESQTAYDAYKALPSEAEYRKSAEMVINLVLLMTTFGTLLAYIALEIIVPLIFKNGRTIGKKIFDIALVRPDCVKISTFSLFVRTILGKFTIGTMIPVFIIYMILLQNIGLIGVIVLAGLLILQLSLLIFTKNRTLIHDLLAFTVAVDNSSQKIFESEEELIEFKKMLHAENVEKADY